ncbi:MAG: DNA helicase II [Methylococcaceae bacterium]|jgi:DNA helicase-2/ATP-dependent DNA helicase PcrA|nr:DNA helicase II [Methylococcaceae bacterium]MDD1643456.1 DNA helicase II [Methylococcaceae bacterium]OYV17268.1 MAG: DNA helicase II / ATP-dependent DNA helicase PcrA [Methylococcaceae bacterium NSM2-1]
MDITKIIGPLNDAQRQAVTAPSQAMLVLAGAGSGKTRVLVHRIAWQIQVEGESAHSILAVTFTNKAAKEMRGRIEDLLKVSAQTLWIGTFHGIAHRLLRRHAKEAKLPETFQVMDSGDQLRVIKRLLNTLNFDDSKWPPREVQWYINAQKDEGIRARHMVEAADIHQRQMLRIYRAYEELCDRSGLVDFAELLLRAHELLRDNPAVLDFYQQRFRQVHVDEFQDTNTIQYAWLRLLTDGKDNLFVVGDDDQSIYGWRGAKIENIYSFQKHYPNHQVIKLEQNYRSTGTILKAANKIIANNAGRMGKELWTDAGEGDKISLYAAFNEQDEAYFVVERIRAWVNEGGLRSDAAILYRSNAQSRQFEEKLMATGTPYRVYGGLRFFDRAEIKNALAYLRLMSNRHDDASFERVINTPTRGIGAKAIDDIRCIARDQSISLWAAAIVLINQRTMTARAANALTGFLELIKNLDKQAEGLALYEKVRLVVEKCGLVELYQKEKMDKGEEKIENLEELVNAARLFDFDQENEENLGELDMFLAHAALESGDSQADDFEDCVQLMTLHSAKGLEFKLVFLVGMEEGLFPSQQSVDDVARLEEERRLCYVGMTRAMKQLYLTYAESRRLYGRESYPRPSRFLREIPAEFLQEVRMRATVSRPVTAVQAKAASLQATGSYKLGQRVGHAKFGEGVVLQMEGSGAQERVQINFKQVGVKWLMLAYAKLEVLQG